MNSVSYFELKLAVFLRNILYIPFKLLLSSRIFFDFHVTAHCSVEIGEPLTSGQS